MRLFRNLKIRVSLEGEHLAESEGRWEQEERYRPLRSLIGERIFTVTVLNIEKNS